MANSTGDRRAMFSSSISTVVAHWRRRQFSHQGAFSQPAFRGGSAMAQAGVRQPSANSGADTAQCGQAALSGLREGLRAQRIFQELEGDRAVEPKGNWAIRARPLDE